MQFYRNITEMIGRTPLLRLGRLAEEQVYAKCEFMNPLSLKDRGGADRRGRRVQGRTAAWKSVDRMHRLWVGISSGATVHATLEIAKADSELVVVCILADTGQRYLSVAGLFEQ